MQLIKKSAPLVRIDGDKPRYVIASTAVDRSGDVLTAKALSAVAAIKSPVTALLHHDHTRVVGKWSDLEFDGTNLTAELTTVEGAPAGLEAKSLLDAGVPLSASVSFRGKGTKNGYGGTTYNEIGLVETSLVVLPANPEAIRIKGLNADLGAELVRLRARALLAIGGEL